MHGCLPLGTPPLTRLLRLHKLLSALEPEYAVFANEPNLLAPGGGTCVEIGLTRRTPCTASAGVAARPAVARVAASPSAAVPATAKASAAPRPRSAANVAVCLVGQLRSLRRTAASLRTHLIDAWGADAFVIATTDSNAPPTAADDAAVGLLGPLRHASVGTESNVLDGSVLSRLERAPLHRFSLLHQQSARDVRCTQANPRAQPATAIPTRRLALSHRLRCAGACFVGGGANRRSKLDQLAAQGLCAAPPRLRVPRCRA